MRLRGWAVGLLLLAAPVGCAGGARPSDAGAGGPPTRDEGSVVDGPNMTQQPETRGPDAGQGAAVGGPAVAGPAVAGPPSAGPVCGFWRGARSVIVTARAGRGDFFREYRYDFATGLVALDDSDPFAAGTETKKPRVIQRSLTLAPPDKARIEQSLLSACPTSADLSRSCAPGGCLRLEVQAGGGPPTVESSPFVRRALELFDTLFPEVRSYE